jgi:hypothetical protein
MRFEQYGDTNFHPIAIFFMACMLVLAFWPKRSTSVLAVLSVCVLMPADQRVVILGLDFSMLRLMMIVVWSRMLLRREQRGFRLGKLDWFVLLWVFSGSFFHVLREGPSSIVYCLGLSFDLLTAYLAIRVLVRTSAEVFIMWRSVAWIAVALAPLLIYEAITRYNVFGVFDYAGFDLAVIRDGEVRAKGPFNHPILAGTFGAAIVPVFVGIFFGSRKRRALFAVASLGATSIVVTSGSSGPLIAWAFGAFGWVIWRFRTHTRKIIWTAICMAAVLHLVREKPVWHLIARLSSIVGGTGYHRFRLIDAFISHFGDWALMGTETTAHWGWWLGDVTNQYVAEGVRGGLIALVFFVLVLTTSFIQLRQAREAYERIEGPKSLRALLAWGTSVSLAVHCTSFMSVAYYGQILPFFAFFIATVPALARFRRPQAVPAPATTTTRPIAQTRVGVKSGRPQVLS